MTSRMWTLDEVVAEALALGPYKGRDKGQVNPKAKPFRGEDNIGLRADPPTVRLQQNGKSNDWIILDDHRWIGGADRFDDALRLANEFLGRPGYIYIYVVNQLGQITKTISSDHAPGFDPKSAVSRSSEHDDQQPSDLAANNGTNAETTINPEAVKSIMGAEWIASAQTAKENGSMDEVSDLVKEAFHIIHLLHPVMEKIGPVIQAIVAAL